ncbi:MAG: hypothetical protein LJE75_09620 [Gammaproteobacteria bacterium]|jgi:hypothetical protein|nr:hypothetical protein [Gammaproteobacteria bacterium]
MGFFDTLFGNRPRQPSPVEEVTRILERFATATSMGVDREDLARYPAKQRQVMAFHFGAIEHLAREFQLDETQILGVFVVFLDRYFIMPITETGSISERVQGFYDKPEECKFLKAGSDVCRRWHDLNERRAPLELGELLKAS